jgi:hypothetical protein
MEQAGKEPAAAKPARTARIERDPRPLKKTEILSVTPVCNPILGPAFGSQLQLRARTCHKAQLIETTSKMSVATKAEGREGRPAMSSGAGEVVDGPCRLRPQPGGGH